MAADQELTAAVAAIKAAARQFAPLLKVAEVADKVLAAANQHAETSALTASLDARAQELQGEIKAMEGALDALKAKGRTAIEQMNLDYDTRRQAAGAAAEQAEKEATAKISAAAEKVKKAESDAATHIANIKADNKSIADRLMEDHKKAITTMTAERDVLKNELDALKTEVADVKSRFSSLLT